MEERSQDTSMIAMKRFGVYRAEADLCNELCEDFRASEKLEARDLLETMEIPVGPSIAEFRTIHINAQQRRNLVQEYERKFEQVSEDQKLSKLCSDADLKLVVKGQYFNTLDTEEGQEMQHLCREYTMLREERSCERMDSQEYENRPSHGLSRHGDRYSFEVLSNLCSKTEPFLGLES